MGEFPVVRVQFVYNGEKILFLKNPYNELLLLYQEIQLINELGTISLEGTEYGVEEIKYCINEFETRYIEIILN